MYLKNITYPIYNKLTYTIVIMKGNQMYTIKDMTEKFGLKASTIRYYEEIGLLNDVEHKDTYHRVYNDSHIDRLSAIECFKKARLPLEDIKQFFEYEKDITANSGKIVDMMKQREESTKVEIENLVSGLQHIQKKIKYYSAVDEAIKNHTPIPSWNEIIECD